MFFIQGYVLVYDVTNFESFGTMDKLKKDIDKNKEKKEVCILTNEVRLAFDTFSACLQGNTKFV